MNKIQLATKFVEDNYSNPKLNQTLICRYLGMDYNKFGIWFKEKMGTNFKDFLAFFRIKTARWLIISTDRTKLETAKSVGYKTGETISRHLKKYYGETFLELKQKNRMRWENVGGYTIK